MSSVLWVRITYLIGQGFIIISSKRRSKKVVSEETKRRGSKKRIFLWQASIRRMPRKGQERDLLPRVGRRKIQAKVKCFACHQ